MERQGPWFTEPAIHILKSFLIEKKAGFAFEFGMGASTKFINSYLWNLYSVDDDKNWHDKYAKYSTCYLLERPYNIVIEQFFDNFFDLIIIDGRDRVKCIESSIYKLKSGGWLILDNSEREYYQKGIDLMKEWNRIDCKQNRPDKYDFTYPNWTTSIFIKP